MTDRARSDPRQILAMMQADWLVAETGEADWVFGHDEPLRRALNRSGGHPAGATGLSIDSYASLAEWFVNGSSKQEAVPDKIAAGLATLTATRAEHLRAAMKDRFHWRLLARPAELVDLDAIILMFLALGGGVNEGVLAQMMHRDLPLVDAPLRIASSLRGDENTIIR